MQLPHFKYDYDATLMHLSVTMGTKVLVQKLNWIRCIGSSGKRRGWGWTFCAAGCC